MFTGIIEEKGNVQAIKKQANAIQMTLAAEKILQDVQIGDSIAVNGVCLTVTSHTKDIFTVDIMPETVKATSLSQLTIGSHVNLERAMAANGRFGGHFVSGHVDGTGTIIKKQAEANAVYYEIQVSDDLLDYMLLKGSVAVDGTSLTIFGVSEKSITLSLIPHTLSETVLGEKGVGDIVNIETDMLGKYVAKFIRKPSQQSNLTESFLESHGFTS
ncbi:riboflavin synthase [Bacillus sp. HMF5848]|uniref:riboflavin synthase n=1 Tax=Bacillus sp. HMF5848 TaxID=2495421 RepID=UPI000F7B6B80|nr:riboflavin synthase [Bacillus sp. HMF5848]RSK27509.1 riboflavin synthase [Bacillus sp. HMF5848]